MPTFVRCASDFQTRLITIYIPQWALEFFTVSSFVEFLTGNKTLYIFSKMVKYLRYYHLHITERLYYHNSVSRIQEIQRYHSSVLMLKSVAIYVS